MSWLLALAGFSVLIVLHEFGHFIAAKRTGMRVERFFLFFPPKVVSVKRGETEYGIGAIPAGGFVKITGMNPDEELPPEIEHRGYYHQPVWKRIVVIGAGPAMNLLIAFLILFGLAFGATRATQLDVGGIEKGSPAEGQLHEDDRILSVDGVVPTNGGAEPSNEQLGDRAQAFADQINTHGCAIDPPTDGCKAAVPTRVVVERDGSKETLLITPFYDADVERYRIGFRFVPAGEVPVDYSVGEAATNALDDMWFVTSQTATVLARIVDPEQRKQITGVVGSYETTRQAIDFDWRTALLVLAVISLSLAIINLFPFLPLDGGHIFWSIVEKVRGRPVAFSTMERSGAIGFVLIIFLAFIGLSNDLDRIISGEGFGVR